MKIELPVEEVEIDKMLSPKESESMHRYVIRRGIRLNGSVRKLTKPKPKRKSKLNSYQVENLSEWLTDKVIPYEKTNINIHALKNSIARILKNVQRSSTSMDNFFRALNHVYENSFTYPRKRKEIAGYIILQGEDRERFRERISEDLKISYIPTPFSEPQNSVNDLDFVEYVNKPGISFRNQVKNLIKRLITRQKQQTRKAKSVVQTLIKFIIISRLFGVYVSEEDNNRVAISASLTVSF